MDASERKTLYDVEVSKAEMALLREFRTWERKMLFPADFFDPRNRDMWMRSFAEYLARPREFASND
jgi:hypothetical protein